MIIAIETKEDIVTCISCRHSHISFTNLLLSGQQYAQCKRTERSTTTYDPVTGKTVAKVDMHYCNTERGDFGGRLEECGPKGVYWVPKHTRDVFKALRKG